MNRLVYVIVITFFLHLIANVRTVEESSGEDFDDGTNSTNGSLIFVTGLRNLSRSAGKNLKLTCTVQNFDLNNTNVNFFWKRNEVPVVKSDDNRFKIVPNKGPDNKFTSTLRVSNLDFFDKGFYQCIASNGVNKVRSEAYILVSPDDNKYGTADTSTYDILKTSPEKHGEITTFIPNTISKLESPNIITTIQQETPKIEFENVATAKNVDKAPLKLADESFCQPYRGKRCKEYLSNQNVFVQPPYTQDEIEEKLENAFIVVSRSNDISTSCNKFAQPSLCYSAFPICSDPYQINQYRQKLISRNVELKKEHLSNIRTNLTHYLKRICRDECMLLENELCSKEYSIAKTHTIIGQIMELEECEKLPAEMYKSGSNCLDLGVGDLNVVRDETCYWYKGKDYKGAQDTSKSGQKCLRWSHHFHLRLSDYPELAGHNYCRNPGDMEDEPFCYTEENKKEHCGIRNCEYLFGIYIAVVASIIVTVISLLFFFCYCRKRNKIARNLQNKDLPSVNKNIYGGNPGSSSPIELNTLLPPHFPPQRSHHSSNKNSFQNVPQYTYNEVRLLEELGEGAFGKVYKGELKAKSGKIFVAVKSLKENATAKTQADFQREIELISELKHPNIICLLGVITKKEPMCMLFEFMSEGDLHEFLIANSPENSKCLTHDQFLHIAIQIGQGMDYLSSNHYVHRDLAARNCLVSKDMVVKISDFGLSRDMYSCDYYRVQSKSLLPVRWMPPESILYGKFTTESDVWSYGVVLWEIYSYGVQPYFGQNNQEVINMIRSRKLLGCPDACPTYCYSLMVECWAEQPMRRPTFAEIVHRLNLWKQSGPSNGSCFKPSSSSCQPTPQKYGHSSKSSHTSDGTQFPTDLTSLTWERDRQKPSSSSSRLHDSQSSLTSRASSIGNNTQSTNISGDYRRERRSRKNIDSLERLGNPKNMVVSSNGDNFETKISQ